MKPLIILPPVIAHRGANAYAPENTLAAFKKAKQLGINWVEFDCMLAQCGEVVVIHDEDLDRTTNGSGKVSAYPYTYLKTLDAGSWFNPLFANEKIPTLREVLLFLTEQQLAANIEIKPLLGHEEVTVEKIMQVIAEHGENLISPPLISSFSQPALQSVRKKSSQALLGFLMDSWQESWQAICDELNCISVNVNHEILTAEKVGLIKATGRTLLAYTVNDHHQAETLFSWGVDALFSDYPENMRVFVNKS